MEKGCIVLLNDPSPISVIRVEKFHTFWYYLSDYKVFITESGEVVPDVPPSDGVEGEVAGDTAVAFRIFLKIYEIKEFVTNLLNSKSVF